MYRDTSSVGTEVQAVYRGQCRGVTGTQAVTLYPCDSFVGRNMHTIYYGST